MVMETTATFTDYTQAAALLWGPAGEYAASEIERLNREILDGELPPLPVVIGLTAYGKCIGATLPPRWLAEPRITLAPAIFNRGGKRMVSDVLVHEMVHAALMLAGQSPDHNDDPWCQRITALSPKLLGQEITARPVRPKRYPNPAREQNPKAPKTVVRRCPEEGALSQQQLATWPHSVRPAGYYLDQEPLAVPTY